MPGKSSDETRNSTGSGFEPVHVRGQPLMWVPNHESEYSPDVVQ
jgi:hypothetical protein